MRYYSFACLGVTPKEYCENKNRNLNKIGNLLISPQTGVL